MLPQPALSETRPATGLQPLAASDVVDVSAICPGRVHDDEALGALKCSESGSE